MHSIKFNFRQNSACHMEI